MQLNKGYGADECRRLVERVHADALVLHLNALQEALQPEGDTCFRGPLEKIEPSARQSSSGRRQGSGLGDRPRCGTRAVRRRVSPRSTRGRRRNVVERSRASSYRPALAAAGRRRFAGWGIPTAKCLRRAAQSRPPKPSSQAEAFAGGLDVAKALASGADPAGVAGPFLRAADAGEMRAGELARENVEMLRVAMFAFGIPTLAALRGTPRLVEAAGFR